MMLVKLKAAYCLNLILIQILDFFIRKNERIEISYFKYDSLLFSILIILILEKFGNYKEFIYFQF